MIATDPETETGGGPIRGTSGSLENRKPPPQHVRHIKYALRRFVPRVARKAMEVAILDEYACKLAAVAICLPRVQRQDAIRVLLSERHAKLQRFHETDRNFKNVTLEIMAQPINSRSRRVYLRTRVGRGRPLFRRSSCAFTRSFFL
jgi:hypothetical protein